MSTLMLGYAFRYRGQALKKLIAIYVMDHISVADELCSPTGPSIAERFTEGAANFCTIDPVDAYEAIQSLCDEGFFSSSEIAAREEESANRDHSHRRKKRKIPRHRCMHVFYRDGFSCKHCGSKEDLTIDHIYPEVHGGTDYCENLQTLCRRCNSVKGDSIPYPGERK